MKYWTKSWNTIYGCTKIREGCRNCWALEMSKRMQGNGLLSSVVDEHGNWTGHIEYKQERLDMPLKWKKSEIVAVNWMSDTFHERAGGIFYTLYNMIRLAQHHTYLMLTKRYQTAARFASTISPLPCLLLGVTISNQSDADFALDQIEAYRVKNWKWWVSYEPALERVDWSGWEFIDGLVCGAESGRNKRPMPIEAAMEARGFCGWKNIPFTFKQGNNGEQTLMGQEHYEFPSSTKVPL